MKVWPFTAMNAIGTISFNLLISLTKHEIYADGEKLAASRRRVAELYSSLGIQGCPKKSRDVAGKSQRNASTPMGEKNGSKPPLKVSSQKKPSLSIPGR